MAYSEKVVEHAENPRNVGTLDKDDPNVGTGLVGAPACGDVMRLQIKVSDDGVIQDAKFKTFGCGSAIASSSLATEWIKGKKVEEAETIKNSDIVNELNLPPVKIHCSVLAEDAIKSAIEDYRQKQAAKLQNNHRHVSGHEHRPGVETVRQRPSPSASTTRRRRRSGSRSPKPRSMRSRSRSRSGVFRAPRCGSASAAAAARASRTWSSSTMASRARATSSTTGKRRTATTSAWSSTRRAFSI